MYTHTTDTHSFLQTHILKFIHITVVLRMYVCIGYSYSSF